MLTNNQHIEVTIEKLTFGGAGLARYRELVVFVPLSAPGDKLLVKISKKKKNYAEAEIVKILEPSPERREPPCPHFYKCGGCDWQHIHYKTQLSEKNEIVKSSFHKAGITADVFHDILASPQEWSYRNRIQLQVKNGQVGFFKKKSHEILSVERCLIAEEIINNKINEARSLAAQNKGSANKVDIRRTPKGSVEVKALVSEGDGDTALGFSQVNTLQNEHMIKTLLGWVNEANTTPRLVDLYCGSGNLTLPLVERLNPIATIGVDLNTQAIQEAKNYESPSLKFLNQDCDTWINSEASKEWAESFFVLDPPRAGAGASVMRALAELRPTRLVYISCDPMTYLRDVKLFLDVTQESGRSYKIKRVQPIDMFPQTHHIEILSLIEPA